MFSPAKDAKNRRNLFIIVELTFADGLVGSWKLATGNMFSKSVGIDEWILIDSDSASGPWATMDPSSLLLVYCPSSIIFHPVYPYIIGINNINHLPSSSIIIFHQFKYSWATNCY